MDDIRMDVAEQQMGLAFPEQRRRLSELDERGAAIEKYAARGRTEPVLAPAPGKSRARRRHK